jgi:hypothetical protein
MFESKVSFPKMSAIPICISRKIFDVKEDIQDTRQIIMSSGCVALAFLNYRLIYS